MIVDFYNEHAGDFTLHFEKNCNVEDVHYMKSGSSHAERVNGDYVSIIQ